MVVHAGGDAGVVAGDLHSGVGVLDPALLLGVICVVCCLRWGSRRGGRYPVCAPTGSVGLAGRLRCGARAARAAAMPLAAALNAPLLHGFSPVRRLRRRTSPCAAVLLAAPQVAHPGYLPPRSTARGVPQGSTRCIGKAVVGCASAATSA